MKYEWKDGSRIKADPQKVGERIATLEDKHGGNVTPRIVVRDARRKSSPLHPCFEWDDGKAAEQYRLSQARYVLRSIVVRVHEREDARPVRAFVIVEENGEQKYADIVRVMSDADLRQQVLQRALREVQEWRERYREYEELAGIFNAIDKAA